MGVDPADGFYDSPDRVFAAGIKFCRHRMVAFRSASQKSARQQQNDLMHLEPHYASITATLSQCIDMIGKAIAPVAKGSNDGGF